MKAAPETGPNRSGTRYSAADKLKAVKLYFEEGYQAKDIARELGIGKSSLGKWIREYREKGSGAFTSPPEKSAAAAEKSDPAGSLSAHKFSNTKPHIRIMASSGSLRSSAAFSVCRSKLMKSALFCRHIRHRQRRPRPAPGVLPLRCGSSNGVLPMNYGTPT